MQNIGKKFLSQICFNEYVKRCFEGEFKLVESSKFWYNKTSRSLLNRNIRQQYKMSIQQENLTKGKVDKSSLHQLQQIKINADKML